MSLSTGSTSEKAVAEDPFRLGWRYVNRPLPDGTVAVDQVPLTEEDVLHPQEDDFIVTSYGHQKDCRYLGTVFTARVADVPGAYVLVDNRVAWDDPEIRPLGPDVAVLFGVERERNWRTFNEVVEGMRPTIIVEVTSDSTRGNDLGIKRSYYEQLGIPYYIIADANDDTDERPIHLIGLRHTDNGFAEMPPNEQGWLWLEPLELWLGASGGRVICYEKDGKEIGDYTKICQTLEAEIQARAEVEQRLNAATNARLQLEAQLKAEAQARSEMERRLQALEAEMRRLRGET